MSDDRTIFPICPRCGNTIDPDICWCGESIGPNIIHDNHYPVPVGCECGRVKKESMTELQDRIEAERVAMTAQPFTPTPERRAAAAITILAGIISNPESNWLKPEACANFAVVCTDLLFEELNKPTPTPSTP